MRNVSDLVVLLAGLCLCALLTGCGGGGGDAPAAAASSPLAGVWAGALVDATGATSTLETEHVVAGGAVKGSARLTLSDGSRYHGSLTGTETAAGMDATIDFGGGPGTLDLRATRNGAVITLTFAPRANAAGTGSGTLARLQQEAVDLSGTYQVDWAANGQSSSFQFAVTRSSGVNTVPVVQIQLVNSIMVFSGSCVGSTIAVDASVFVGQPGTPPNLVRMRFDPAPAAGGSAAVGGTQTGGGSDKPITGTYRLSKVASS